MRLSSEAPQLLPGFFVERSQRLAAAGANDRDELIVNNCQRGRKTVLGSFAAAKGQKVGRPNQFARRGLNTNQSSFCAQGIDQPGINGRRGPRAVAVIAVFIEIVEPGLPNAFAISRIEAQEELARIATDASEGLIADDGNRGKATCAQRHAPELLWAVFRPFGEQARFAGDAVLMRAAPVRPVIGVGGSGKEKFTGGK